MNHHQQENGGPGPPILPNKRLNAKKKKPRKKSREKWKRPQARLRSQRGNANMGCGNYMPLAAGLGLATGDKDAPGGLTEGRPGAKEHEATLKFPLL